MARKRPLNLFVLIDALGWRVLDGREFLSDFLPYRVALRTVLGFSSGAIPTILTGVPPAFHGHWNLFFYDPKGSPFGWLRHFRWLPDRVLDNRLTRRLVTEIGRRVLGLGSLFECCVSPRLLPWLDWVEKRNIYGRGAISGVRSIFDELGERRIPYQAYSYHRGSDAEILDQAQRDLKSSDVGFFFLYLSELDLFLHRCREDASSVEQRLKWYAGRLRQLFALARELDPRVNLTVFSDHGMTPVRHTYDLVREIEALRFSMPEDYLVVYDSTMARFWFFTEKARRVIVDRLNVLSCGRVLSDDELRELGVFFPDRRYGETIFLLHPGWLLAQSDFNGRGWMPAGMHGYHPADPDSDAVFLSNHRPAIEVSTIAEVHRLMHHAAINREL